jgi:moderate conductance mechanosensitive channel
MSPKSLNHNLIFKISLTILIALILQFIAIRLLSFLVRHLVKQSKNESRVDVIKRQKTLNVIFRTTFSALLWIITVITILTMFGINVAALLTGAGIVGVIFGLSAQNTIKDLLSGTFILFEKQFRVGDTVTMSGGSTGFPGVTGKIEQMTLRITKLRDINGNLVTVRNGEPTIIKNETYSYSSIVLDFTVTYDSNIEIFKNIINKIGKEIAHEQKWQPIVKTPISFLMIDSFAPDGVVVRAIGKVSPASQWEIAGDYRLKILKAVSASKEVNFAHS